jgi:hypothetical protein
MRLRRESAASSTGARMPWAPVLLAVIVGVVAFIRARLIDMPLERDEGEFAYGAQMLLQGLSPYKHAYDVTLKLPGTCVAYAGAMSVFGQTTVAIHLLVILVTSATALFIYLVARRFSGEGAGLAAAATYALLAVNPASFGLAAHATHFVVLPAMAGVFLLTSLDDRSSLARIFSAGLLLGVAIVMKQTGAVFGLFAAVWVARCEFCFANKNRARLLKRLGALAAGGVLPFLVTCALIALAGDWQQFVLWTFKFAGAHANTVSFRVGVATVGGAVLELFKGTPALWVVALMGLLLLLWTKALRPSRFFILSFFVFSLVAVYPGWREHYFIQLFPATGLLVGAAFQWLEAYLQPLKTRGAAAAILFVVFAGAGVSTLVEGRKIYFSDTPAQACRSIYGLNPFPEAVEVAKYLAEHCSKDGRIAVIGSEPEIYFYSKRQAATGHICTYPLMEPQPYAEAMQKQMIEEIERNAPEYVVFVRVEPSWLRRPDSNPLLLNWFPDYGRKHLRMVGMVVIGPDRTEFRWLNQGDPPIRTTQDVWLGVYKRL